MPCDSVTTQSVNLANAMPELVADAMKACGFNLRSKTLSRITARNRDWTEVTWVKGQGLTVLGNSNPETITKLTQAYSQKAVTWAAQRAGWTVKQTSANTLAMTRR